MSDHLPLDLVNNILLRLPVAAILRCRSVCKPWRALIDSPRFVKLQKDYSAATTQNAVLFILEDDGDKNGDLHFVPYIDGLRRGTCLDLRSNQSSSAQIRATIPRESITLCGSCNGLLCFSSYNTDKAVIMNPATRKSHVTPAIPSRLPHVDMNKDWIYRSGFGFGYDSVSDDYKVVKVNQLLERMENGEFHSELISYGVRSNSSVAVKFPYVLDVTEKIGVLVGGAIHWVAIKPVVLSLIVGFGLGVSECKEIPEPEYPKGKSFSMGMGKLGECLCLFANYGKFVDVWMMKEYGVKESWSVLFSVPHPGLSYFGIRSLGFSMTGQEVLLELDAETLVWYDLKKNPQRNAAAKKIRVRGLKKKAFIDAIVCFGSLVSPPKEEVKVDKQRKKKKRDDLLSAAFKLKL